MPEGGIKTRGGGNSSQKKRTHNSSIRSDKIDPDKRVAIRRIVDVFIITFIYSFRSFFIFFVGCEYYFILDLQNS
jgi:hypothetical protein